MVPRERFRARLLVSHPEADVDGQLIEQARPRLGRLVPLRLNEKESRQVSYYLAKPCWLVEAWIERIDSR